MNGERNIKASSEVADLVHSECYCGARTVSFDALDLRAPAPRPEMTKLQDNAFQNGYRTQPHVYPC